MKKIIIAIALALCAFGVRAENEPAATSKEYVDAELATKQPTVPAEGANVVMTFDSNATDGIGTKNIYDPSVAYKNQQDALLTAATANSAVQMAINGEFVCHEWNPDDSTDCWLWDIKTPNTVQSKNRFDFKNSEVAYKASGVQVTKLSNGYTVTGNDGTLGTIFEIGNLGDFIGKTWTISSQRSCKNNGVSMIYFVQLDNNNYPKMTHNALGGTSGSTATITNRALNATKLGFALRVLDNGSNNENRSCTYRNIQVEEGSTATAYEPYGGLYIPQNVQ